MIQAAQGFPLGLPGGDSLGRSDSMLVRHFDGNLASQHLIVALVDGCEPAGPDLFGDYISAQGEWYESLWRFLADFRRQSFAFDMGGMHPASCAVNGGSVAEVLRHGWGASTWMLFNDQGCIIAQR